MSWGKWFWLQESSSSSIIAFLKDLLEEGEDEAKESIDEFYDGEDGSSDPKAQVSANRPQKCGKTLDNQIYFETSTISSVWFFNHRCMLDCLYEVKGGIVNLRILVKIDFEVSAAHLKGNNVKVSGVVHHKSPNRFHCWSCLLAG